MRFTTALLAFGLTTIVSAQEYFDIFLYPQGSDCDGSDSTTVGGNYEVSGSGQCISIGQDNYDIRLGWTVLTANDVIPPVYACPDSSCSSGCSQLWDSGYSTGGDSSCENASNAPYILVDGET